MWVFSNHMSGGVPSQLGQLTKTSYNMWLDNNRFETIPTQLGQLNKLDSGFKLSTNLLHSSIPTELGMLDQM